MKRQGLGRSWIWRLGFTVLVWHWRGVLLGRRSRGSAAAPQSPHATAASSDGQRAAGGSVVLGGSPGTPAARYPYGDALRSDPVHWTNFCSPDKPGHVVDVINAATCNAKGGSGCRVVARARVGSSPARRGRG